MVYDKNMIEDRYLLLIQNSVNPIYYYDVTTIWNIIEDLKKDLDIYWKKLAIHPQQVTVIDQLPKQNMEVKKLKVKIDRETKITITHY